MGERAVEKAQRRAASTRATGTSRPAAHDSGASRGASSDSPCRQPRGNRHIRRCGSAICGQGYAHEPFSPVPAAHAARVLTPARRPRRPPPCGAHTRPPQARARHVHARRARSTSNLTSRAGGRIRDPHPWRRRTQLGGEGAPGPVRQALPLVLLVSAAAHDVELGGTRNSRRGRGPLRAGRGSLMEAVDPGGHESCSLATKAAAGVFARFSKHWSCVETQPP